jgi:hypothetical protein
LKKMARDVLFRTDFFILPTLCTYEKLVNSFLDHKQRSQRGDDDDDDTKCDSKGS